MLVVSIKLLEERVRNKRQAFGCGHSAKRRSESQAVSIEIGIEWASPVFHPESRGPGYCGPKQPFLTRLTFRKTLKHPLILFEFNN